MNTDQLLDKIGNLIDQKIKPLQEGQARIEKRQEQQGKIIMAVSAHTATVLEEQQQQRTDIRSLHTEVHETKEELKAGQDTIQEDIHRVEQKVDNVARDVKSQKSRIENLEEHTKTPNPHKN